MTRDAVTQHSSRTRTASARRPRSSSVGKQPTSNARSRRRHERFSLSPEARITPARRRQTTIANARIVGVIAVHSPDFRRKGIWLSQPLMPAKADGGSLGSDLQLLLVQVRVVGGAPCAQAILVITKSPRTRPGTRNAAVTRRAHRSHAGSPRTAGQARRASRPLNRVDLLALPRGVVVCSRRVRRASKSSRSSRRTRS